MYGHLLLNDEFIKVKIEGKIEKKGEKNQDTILFGQYFMQDACCTDQIKENVKVSDEFDNDDEIRADVSRSI